MQSDKAESGCCSASELVTQRSQSFVVISDTKGKHRMQAEFNRLDQEARFLEEELEQLGKIDNASAACKEVVSMVESRPDPLLPVTNGPLNPLWDRWFEGPQETKGCRCWIL